MRAALAAALAAVGACGPPEGASARISGREAATAASGTTGSAGGEIGAGSGGGGAPISCGEPKPASTIPFTDVTDELGIDFVQHNTTEYCDMPDVVAGGVCLFDYDRDGDLDMYLVDRAPYPNRLYRNDGAAFTDVTDEAGDAGSTGDSVGCLAFDYDGDFDLDLFVSDTGNDQLLRNDDGVFTDVSAEAGIADGGFSTSATAGDIDGDGDLDLYVARFGNPAAPNAPCDALMTHNIAPIPNVLWLNEGGTFVDVTEERDMQNWEPTFATMLVDFDEDGDLDVYVGNDFGKYFPDRMFLNDGDGHFHDAAPEMGLAFGNDGQSGCTMGASVGDYDLDGRLDLVSTNFQYLPTLLFDCQPGPACFDNRVAGLEPSKKSLNWAVHFADFDQNGELDVFQTSGHIVHNIPQRNELYWNQLGKFVEHVPVDGEALAAVQNSRGAAYGDLDGDGDLDVVVANNGDRPQVLRNDGAWGHWLLVELDTLSVGARVTVTAEGRKRTHPVLAGGGFLGSSDHRVHFGLGAACVADVVVRWLDGTVRDLGTVAANQVLRVEKDSE